MLTTSEKTKILKSYKDAQGISLEYCMPYFQKFVRFYRLFSGIRPPEIDTTYSQIMLWYPYAIIENEMPYLLRSLFSKPDWLDVQALDYEDEEDAELCQKWLKYQFERVQKIKTTTIPIMQNVGIFGTGYKFYSVAPRTITKTKRRMIQGMMGNVVDFQDETINKQKTVINGQYVNIFNVLPSPMGGQVNGFDGDNDGAISELQVQVWLNRSRLEAWVSNPESGIDKDEMAKFLANPMGDPDPTEQVKTDLASSKTGWTEFSQPIWASKAIAGKLDIENKMRCTWYFQRDRWSLIGADRYVLYSDKPLIDMFPIAKFTSSFNMDNWFGYGLLEPTEDLLIAMTMNFNLRMDYLAGVFHPTTYIPQKLVDDVGGGTEIFDQEPYKIIPYNHKQFIGGIGNYIHHDGNENINQQAFIEEGKMQGYLESIISQHGVTSLQGETATSFQGLIGKDSARSLLRAINVENTGMNDSAILTLAYAEKFLVEDEAVKVNRGDGYPWEFIPASALTRHYDIKFNGASSLQLAEITFKNMLSIAPLLLQNPQIRGQMEAVKQMATIAGFDRVDDIINGKPEPQPRASQQMLPEPQGAMPSFGGGISTVGNDIQGSQNGMMRTGETGMENVLI